LLIKGITLHSYRYAWAEHARTCGYPERFAQEALGHNSNAVHRAYARKSASHDSNLGRLREETSSRRKRHCADASGGYCLIGEQTTKAAFK
jgi:integrase